MLVFHCNEFISTGKIDVKVFWTKFEFSWNCRATLPARILTEG